MLVKECIKDFNLLISEERVCVSFEDTSFEDRSLELCRDFPRGELLALDVPRVEATLQRTL